MIQSKSFDQLNHPTESCSHIKRQRFKLFVHSLIECFNGPTHEYNDIPYMLYFKKKDRLTIIRKMKYSALSAADSFIRESTIPLDFKAVHFIRFAGVDSTFFETDAELLRDGIDSLQVGQ